MHTTQPLTASTCSKAPTHTGYAHTSHSCKVLRAGEEKSNHAQALAHANKLSAPIPIPQESDSSEEEEEEEEESEEEVKPKRGGRARAGAKAKPRARGAAAKTTPAPKGGGRGRARTQSTGSRGRKRKLESEEVPEWVLPESADDLMLAGYGIVSHFPLFSRPLNHLPRSLLRRAQIQYSSPGLASLVSSFSQE